MPTTFQKVGIVIAAVASLAASAFAGRQSVKPWRADVSASISVDSSPNQLHPSQDAMTRVGFSGRWHKPGNRAADPVVVQGECSHAIMACSVVETAFVYHEVKVASRVYKITSWTDGQLVASLSDTRGEVTITVDFTKLSAARQTVIKAGRVGSDSVPARTYLEPLLDENGKPVESAINPDASSSAASRLTP